MSSFAKQSYFGSNIELVLNLWGKMLFALGNYLSFQFVTGKVGIQS